MTKILICDDEGIVRQSLQFMIEKAFGDECELEFARNGRTAIELAESFHPDIILDRGHAGDPQRGQACDLYRADGL